MSEKLSAKQYAEQLLYKPEYAAATIASSNISDQTPPQ